MICNTGIIG